VELTFYEKKNMWPALRAAFTAGSGFPDVFYYDTDATEFMAAGWLADLTGGITWANVEPYGKAFWSRPGPGGKTGIWAIPVEAARYFHTEQKACMFPVGSWYTGRAFVPPDKGGQPKDFELGLLNYPQMKDGKGAGEKYLGVAGSLAVAAKSPNLALALELANT